jgi:GNAT superfamily N-acetyltransferase
MVDLDSKTVSANMQSSVNLPLIKRFEAVSFRAWPATSTYFEGAWAIRLTAGHPAKRLNSVNPLDPSDCRDLEERIERTAKRFSAFGRPFIFRQSPLAAPQLVELLDQQGWSSFDESMVMVADLQEMEMEQALDQLPLRDGGHWIDQLIKMEAVSADLKPGLSELITRISGSYGMFLIENEKKSPLAGSLCVHDKELAGLFEVVANPAFRRQGHGRRIVETALKWAKLHGAKEAWLQVECDNLAAQELYFSLGFVEKYRYIYRKNKT